MRVEIKELQLVDSLIPKGNRRAAAHAAGRAWINSIKTRTSRGNRYGPRSRPRGNRGKYGSVYRYNAEYARKKGFPRSPVTMGGRAGGILGYMRHGVKFTNNGFVVGIMFDSRRAERLFKYNQEMGAGRNRIRRQFVFLNNLDRQAMRLAMRPFFKK